MKQLKDFIHLYLGCEAICEGKKCILESVAKHDAMDTYSVIYEDEEMDWMLHQDFDLIKPILRPLSNMREEDYSDWRKIEKASIYDKYRDTRWEAERTKFLLSKHFDLFGLIECGLAIDATTIKQ